MLISHIYTGRILPIKYKIVGDTATVENDENINNERLKEFLQEIIDLKTIANVAFHKCKLLITEMLVLEIKNKEKCRSLYSISIEECSIDKDTVVYICNSVEGLSSIDLSNNELNKEEANFICDNLKYLDFIYMYDNYDSLSAVDAENLIYSKKKKKVIA